MGGPGASPLGTWESRSRAESPCPTVPISGTHDPEMGTTIILSETLFGRTRGAVLAVLYGHIGESFYLRRAGGAPCAFKTLTIPTTEGAPSFALFAKGGLAGTSTGGCPAPRLWGPGNQGRTELPYPPHPFRVHQTPKWVQPPSSPKPSSAARAARSSPCSLATSASPSISASFPAEPASPSAPSGNRGNRGT